MKIQTYLRRTAAEGTGYSLVVRNNLAVAAARIDTLEAELRKYRRDHDVICASQSFTGGQGLEFIPCNCGAAGFNESIEKVLAAGEMNSHKY
jgi:hypothetical protein